MLGTSHSIDYPTSKQHFWQALEYETEKNNYRYNLQAHDITYIARIMHKWDKGYEEVNYKTQFYEENQQGERVYYSRTQSNVMFDVFSLGELTQKLKDFKGDWNIRSELPLMAIIDLEDFWWVTLVIAYNDSKETYYAYYCDSLKVGVHSEVRKNLESEIPSIVIVDLSSEQQEYSYDSGIFALDNAKKINETLDKDRFFSGTYNANLLSEEQLIEKRKEFSQKLLNSYGRMIFVESKFVSINSIPQSDYTGLLNLAAEKEYWKIAVSALRKGANVGNLNDNQKVKLYSYIEKHDLNFIEQYPQVVKLLIKSNKDFLSLYKKILKQVVSSLIESGQTNLEIENLIPIIISNINKLESRRLGEYVESEYIDELKKYLVRYDTVSKYLSPLLLKSEYLIGLLSGLEVRLSDFGVRLGGQENHYPFDHDFFNSVDVNFLHLPTFLSMLKALDDYSMLDLADYRKIDTTSRNTYRCLQTGGGEEVEVLSQQLDFFLRHISEIRRLVISCLKGEDNEIRSSAASILQAMREDQGIREMSYPVFAFISSLKALMFRGSGDPFSILDDVFNNINYVDLLSSSGYIETKVFRGRLQDDGYSEYGSSDFDESLDSGIHSLYVELRGILNVLDQAKLLKYIVLFSGNDVSVLDSAWEKLISFQETGRFSLIKDSLSTHLLLQNNIDIFEWYNEKLQEVNSNIVDLMADLWTGKVDYSRGVYDQITYYSSLKLAFNLQEDHSSEELFTWFRDKVSAQEQVSFEARGLACELAVRTKKKENLSMAIRSLLPHIDSIEDQFLYTRLVAAIVIENNVDNMLGTFWTEISKIQNEELQNGIKKRALIDGTWAFHQALKNGNMNIVEWIWSKVDELSEEENIRNEYRYSLLYGLDLSGIESTQKGPIYNAALSGSVDVLKWVYLKMKGIDLKQIPNEKVEMASYLTFRETEKAVFHMSALLNDVEILKEICNHLESDKKQELLEVDSREVFKFATNNRDTAVFDFLLSEGHTLAVQLREEGKYEGSLSLFQTVLAEKESRYGKTYHSTLTAAYEVALAKLLIGEYDQALDMLFELEKKVEKLPRDNFNDILPIYYHEGVALSRMGYFEIALSLFENILKVSQKGSVSRGIRRTILLTRYEVAMLKGKMGWYKDALEELQYVLSKRKDMLYSDILCIKHEMAVLYRCQGKFKDALSFFEDVLNERKRILGENHPDTLSTKYETACTMADLEKYDLALEILLSLKRQDNLNKTLPLLSLEKEIIFIYFSQRRYESVLSYLKSNDFLLIKLPDGKDRCYLANYLSIVTIVAKIFTIQGKYTDALTVLHYEGELRGEIFLKRSDFDSSNDPYIDPYIDPSDMHELYNLEKKYIYSLICFFMSQYRKKIAINEEMFPCVEDLPRESSVQVLFEHLQDILENQESSQYLQPAFYSVEENIDEESQKSLRKKTLQFFEKVLQLQKEYGFLEVHPKVLSVKFYIALLHSQLGDREKALQELQEMQEAQEKVIGINHPDTLETVDAIQRLFTRGEDRLTYLENEMEKRESLLQFEKSDLNARGVSFLKEMHAKENSNDYPSIKRRKIDNQSVSSYLDNIGLSRQQVNLSH